VRAFETRATQLSKNVTTIGRPIKPRVFNLFPRTKAIKSFIDVPFSSREGDSQMPPASRDIADGKIAG